MMPKGKKPWKCRIFGHQEVFESKNCLGVFSEESALAIRTLCRRCDYKSDWSVTEAFDLGIMEFKKGDA